MLQHKLVRIYWKVGTQNYKFCTYVDRKILKHKTRKFKKKCDHRNSNTQYLTDLSVRYREKIE